MCKDSALAALPPLLLPLLLSLVPDAIGQHDAAVNAASTPDRSAFEAGSVAVDGHSYPFRLLVPPDPRAPLPLVVFLHGAGERGADNEAQLTWLPDVLASPAQRAAHPCWLLAVQCPEDQRWVDVPWNEVDSSPLPPQPSQPMRATIAALDRVLRERAVDRRRVYLAGLSMGGYGAFDLACRQPDRFAALLPVCGGGDERVAERLVGLPTWIWHGDRDRSVPVQRSRTMAAAIAHAGGDARYTELADVGHDSWKQAYGDGGALDWLFEQRRPQMPIAALVPWPDAVAPIDAPPLRLPPNVPIAAPGGLQAHAAVVAAELQRLGIAARPAGADDAAAVLLRLDPALGPGAFRADFGPEHVVLAGGDVHGVAAASASMLQALRPIDTGDDRGSSAGWELPAATIADTPDHGFRAVMLDCARHFQSLAELRAVVELCRFYRVPFVQLHLSDHEGFRFASTAFPLAVSREHYTVDQLRELCAFAAARGVALIPELDVPGHSSALVAAYPEVFGLADPEARGVVNPGRAAARAGIATLLGELCAVFGDAPYVHIGGDEVDLRGVDTDPDCVACMQQHGLRDATALLRWFVAEIHAEVRRLGRRTLVWEGFAPGSEPPMPQDLIVVAWESAYYPPDRLVADGFQVVNASWQPLYVVGGGALPPHQAPRRWNAPALFRWQPRRWEHFAPDYPSFAGIDLPPDAPVLGAMMCVWEQHSGTAARDLRRRLPVFAERCAHVAADRGYAEFAARARSTDARFERIRGEHPPGVADEWDAFLASGEPRVHYRWFQAPRAGFDAIPDFAALAPFASGWQPGFRGGALAGPLGVELTATLEVTEDGDYGLALECADGLAQLLVDGGVVLQQRQRSHWQPVEVTLPLRRGAVALRVDCAQGAFHTLCRVTWRPPGTDGFTPIEPALRVRR